MSNEEQRNMNDDKKAAGKRAIEEKQKTDHPHDKKTYEVRLRHPKSAKGL